MDFLVKYRNTVINVVATGLTLLVAVGLLQPSAAATPAQVATDFDTVVAGVGVVVGLVNAVLHMLPDNADKAKAAASAPVAPAPKAA